MSISYHLKVGGITLENNLTELDNAKALIQTPVRENKHTLSERISSKVRMVFGRSIRSDAGVGALIHQLKGAGQKLVSPTGGPVIVQIIKKEDGSEEVLKAGIYDLRFNEMRSLTAFDKHIAVDPTIGGALEKLHNARLNLVHKIDSWYLTRGRRNAALTKARSIYDTAMGEFRAKFGDEHRAAMHRSFDEVQYNTEEHQAAKAILAEKKEELEVAHKAVTILDRKLELAIEQGDDQDALKEELRGALAALEAAEAAYKAAEEDVFSKRDQSLSQQMLDIADRTHLQMIRVLLKKGSKRPKDTTATVKFFEKNFAAFNTAEIRGFVDRAFGRTVRARFRFATKGIPGVARGTRFQNHFGQITTQGTHWALPLHRFLKKGDFEVPTQENLARLATDLKKCEWSFCR